LAQVVGTQAEAPQTPGVPPPPQVWGEVQVPQLSWLPQPSPAGPQERFCCAQVRGVQLLPPQTPGVPPPPQVWGEVQVPQSISPPQPSPAGPQLKLS
jgi:hypothetical protein